MGDGGDKKAAEKRARRLAEALRANLKRRKAQARSRAPGAGSASRRPAPKDKS